MTGPSPSKMLEVGGWTLALASGLATELRHSLLQTALDPLSASASASIKVVPGQRLLLNLSNPSPPAGCYELEMAAGLTGKCSARLSFDVAAAQSSAEGPARAGQPAEWPGAGKAVNLWLDGAGPERKVALGSDQSKDDEGKTWAWIELNDANRVPDALEGLLVLRLYLLDTISSDELAASAKVSLRDDRTADSVLSDRVADVHSDGVGERPQMDASVDTSSSKTATSSHILKGAELRLPRTAVATFVISYGLASNPPLVVSASSEAPGLKGVLSIPPVRSKRCLSPSADSESPLPSKIQSARKKARAKEAARSQPASSSITTNRTADAPPPSAAGSPQAPLRQTSKAPDVSELSSMLAKTRARQEANDKAKASSSQPSGQKPAEGLSDATPAAPPARAVSEVVEAVFERADRIANRRGLLTSSAVRADCSSTCTTHPSSDSHSTRESANDAPTAVGGDAIGSQGKASSGSVADEDDEDDEDEGSDASDPESDDDSHAASQTDADEAGQVDRTYSVTEKGDAIRSTAGEKGPAAPCGGAPAAAPAEGEPTEDVVMAAHDEVVELGDSDSESDLDGKVREETLRSEIASRFCKAVRQEAEKQARPYRLVKTEGSQEDQDAVVAAVIATVKGRCKAKVLELTLAFLARLDPAYQWPAPIDLEASPSTHVFDLLDYLDDAISDAVNAEELEKMSALRTAWRASWGDSPQAMIEGRREITFRCVKERAEAAVRSAAESI